jgi:hypothetical protein
MATTTNLAPPRRLNGTQGDESLCGDPKRTTHARANYSGVYGDVSTVTNPTNSLATDRGDSRRLVPRRTFVLSLLGIDHPGDTARPHHHSMSRTNDALLAN